MARLGWIRRVFTFVTALAVVVGGALSGLPTTAAALPVGAPPAETSLLGTPGIDPVLDSVEVVATAQTRRADKTVLTKQKAKGTANDRSIAADQARSEVVAQSTQAATKVQQAAAVVAQVAAELERQKVRLAAREAVTARRKATLTDEQDHLRVLAVSMYTAKSVDDTMALGTFDAMSAGKRRQAVRGQVVDEQARVTDAAEREWRIARGASRAQGRRVDRVAASRAKAQRALKDAQEVRDHLVAFLQKAEARAAARRADLDRATVARDAALIDRRRARLGASVKGLDFPLVALYAYWRAAAVAPCAIPWWLLAGIGRVETRHGTANGARLLVNGTTSLRILGIALDGRPGVAAISDTDGGALDGDTRWDRAVGPMQFIPGTWRRWALDGNGDDKADPHNLYDAAAAASNYLCFGRGDMASEGVQRVALLSYNRSVPYGTQVLQHGNRYRDELGLPDLPPKALPTDPTAVTD